MKKIVLYGLLITMLSLSACAGGSNNVSNQTPDSEELASETPTPTGVTSETENASSTPETNSSISVDKGLFDVTLNLPASFFEGTSPEDVIKNAKDEGITATPNDDGSYAYKMSKAKHGEMMSDMAEGIESSVAEILSEKTYASVSNVEYNADFTEFNVTADKTAFESNFMDSFAILTFGLQGTMYQTFNGTPDNKVTINVVDTATKEVFKTTVYPDALNQ